MNREGYLEISLTSENELREKPKSMSRKHNRPGLLRRKMNREGYLEVSLTSENELRETKNQ